MMIRAELSSDTIAVSCAIEIKSPSPVLALCRRLIEEGCLSSTPMEAYRGDTLALHVRSIGEAAALEVQHERFVKPKRRLTAPSMKSHGPVLTPTASTG